VSAFYHIVFRDENPYAGTTGFSSDGCLRGQLLTGLLTHKFNEHVAVHLLGEAFFPGDYYDNTRNDVAFFLRAQLTFSW